MKNSQGIYINELPKSNLVKRLLWNVVYRILIKPFPSFFFRKWRILIYNLFGAKVDMTANIYSSAKVSSPWNLIMHSNACVGPYVIVDNGSSVTIHKNATVSQHSYICTSSHDIYHKHHKLISAPIEICEDAWIAAGVFIGMGCIIGTGSVVGARAVVVKNVDPWTVVAGNPARKIKDRQFKD